MILEKSFNVSEMNMGIACSQNNKQRHRAGLGQSSWVSRYRIRIQTSLLTRDVLFFLSSSCSGQEGDIGTSHLEP